MLSLTGLVLTLPRQGRTQSKSMVAKFSLLEERKKKSKYTNINFLSTYRCAFTKPTYRLVNAHLQVDKKLLLNGFRPAELMSLLNTLLDVFRFAFRRRPS